MDYTIIILLLFVLVLATLLGLELISKVPSTLHTPLMAGTNAISGVTIVGALLATNADGIVFYIGLAAVFFATINVFGGYLVTNRMLGFFQGKKSKGS